MTAARTGVPATRAWCARCAWALVVFQLVIAGAVWLNQDSEQAAFLSGGLAPTPAAAQGAVLGALVVHLVLAVACVRVALSVPRGRRWAQVFASVPLVAIAVGGLAALGLPGQTWLSPLGVALAVAALVLLWWPAGAAGRFRGTAPPASRPG